jgi:hypothetical protein
MPSVQRLLLHQPHKLRRRHLHLHRPRMHEDDSAFKLPPPQPPEFEPIVFKLANGHDVKIVARVWPAWRSYEEWAAGVWPDPYFGIRIYCTEGSLPKRLVWIEEFREHRDFNLTSAHSIWHWLTELTASRMVFDFDDFREFLDHVTEGIAHLSTHEHDAVEHFEELPRLTAPDWFDRIDDSVFNDHNITAHEQSDTEEP